MRRLIFEFGAAILAGLILGCATVPVTGRRAMILVPESEVTALAAGSYRELLQKSKLSQDQEAVEMIRRVGERIARATGKKDYRWEFNLIDDPKTVNAFCMPGGKVAFYTGILPVAKTEAGVAVVMGHEVAHAIAKHGAERMSQQLLVNFGAISLGEAMRNKPERTQALASVAFGLGANLGYVLPYSRMQESEADRIGLVYMAEAGYDPQEAVAFWERMSKLGGEKPPEFLSTHPADARRIKDLQRWLPEAQKAYRRNN